MNEELQRFRFIAENTLDLICETNIEGFYTYLSPGYRDVLGYEPEELIDQHFSLLVHPDDRQAVLAAFTRRASDLRPGLATYRHRHKDGTWRWLESLGKPLPYSGDTFRALFVSRDITERKTAELRLNRMEDRLKMVVNRLPVILCATDPAGIVTLFEGQGLEGLGLSPSSVLGNPIVKVYKNQPEVLSLVQRALAGDTVVATVRAQGRVFEAYLAPAYDERKVISGIAGLFIDVTEGLAVRRALDEERLKRSKLQSLAVLAGGITHDFNNLLTAVLGNISLAQMEATPHSPVVEHLAEAERACLRTRDLISELSTFAKGGDPVKKPIRIEQSIRQAVSAATRGTGIQSEIHIQPGLWAVSADEPQINQVLQNIIMNARQAMPGGGSIKIAGRNSPGHESLSPGRYVVLRITDHGTGIAREHIDRIFEPYFTTKKEGHGLGLATAHSIISHHGGALLAESPPGGGATFTIYLPASDEAVELPPGEPPRKAVAAPATRILIMDDDDSIRALMRRILSGNGFQVEATKEGGEAVRRHREALETGKPFSLVLLDIRVPHGMGGLEALRAIQAIDPGIKAIISSGYSENPVMSNYKELGIAAVVPKPYHAHELLSVVRQLLSAKPAA